jgi:hypothetical protein
MDKRTDGQTDNGLLQVPSENNKVRTIASKFHQNPTIPSEDCGKHSANQILCRLIKYARNLLNIELDKKTYVLSMTQASFIKIPSFLLKISWGKHSANHIEAASLNMHGICQTSNLNEGLISYIHCTKYHKQVSSKSHNSFRRDHAENIQSIRLQ